MADIRNLTELDLVATKVTDAGLRELTQLKKLSRLSLEGEGISDVGLSALAHHNLTVLDLMDTRVTDVGLKHLVSFANLTQLLLNRTKVTIAGL